MIGWTLCSGIGAPELAAPWVDWRLAAEIEPFPRAVLQQRFAYKAPADHNQGDPLLWGDMTEVTPELARKHGVPLPDLLVAGTPCQAFSIAGLRGGTDDERGNLTLKFVETCHAIVAARPDRSLTVLWENVPGVLSDKGNAFGCFLGGLVGADDALCHPRGESWPCEGMVEGPRARVAWRVLDAQYFGLAQRRRRVFAVICFGNGADPASVLFERQSEGGNTPPRRETGQGAAAASGSGAEDRSKAAIQLHEYSAGQYAFGERLAGLDLSRLSRGKFRSDIVRDADLRMVRRNISSKPSHVKSHWDGGPHPSLTQSKNTGGIGASNQELLSQGGAGIVGWPADVAPTLNAPFGEKMGLENQHALNGAGLFVPVAFDCKDTEVQYDASGGETPLRSMGHLNSHQNAGGHAAVAIQERAVSENPNSGPDGAGFRDDDTAYTLEARQVPQAVAFDLRGRDDGAQIESVGQTVSLRAADGGSSRSYVAQAFDPNQVTSKANRSNPTPNLCHTIPNTSLPPHLFYPQVRRLTPTECARLQGFPDDHCAITYRGKPAADGNQYKVFGNSMARDCIEWITNRIRIAILEARK